MYKDKYNDRYKNRYANKYNAKHINNKIEERKRSPLARNLKWFFIIWFFVGVIKAIERIYSTGNIWLGLFIIILNATVLLLLIIVILVFIKVRKIMKSDITN